MMEIIYFPAIVHQCNIANGVVHILNIFLFIVSPFLAGQPNG